MTWLPTWKIDANSPISLSLFISNFKFQIHVHNNTFEVSLLLYCSFSSLLCCDSPWRPPRHRRPDEQSSPTPATIEVERSFYNPSDPTSAASDDNESHSRRLTSESLSVFPSNSHLLTLCFLDRSVCTDVNFSVNGSTSDQLTYCNRNCPKCRKKATIQISETERNKNKLFYCCHDCGGFIGWCLPTNSQSRDEGQMRMNNIPIVTEQLRSIGEQLQFQSAQMQKLQRAGLLDGVCLQIHNLGMNGKCEWTIYQLSPNNFEV